MSAAVTAVGEGWREGGLLDMAAPVLTVLGDRQGTWAGGFGGVARERDGRWSTAPVAVGPVVALAGVDGRVVAGGAGGLVHTADGGLSWSRGRVYGGAYPVAGLTAMRGIALAATLGGGVLRSEDAGQTWRPANFGLTDLEVTALDWADAEDVLACTASGLFRSANGGRAWRLVAGTESWPVAAVASAPGGGAVAVGEDGVLQRSTDRGAQWARCGMLPDGAAAAACVVGDSSILVGTLSHGVLRSVGDGTVWEQSQPAATYAFDVAGDVVLAATGGGVLASADSGRTWDAHGAPTLHDLARLVATASGALFAWGVNAGLVRCSPEPERIEVAPHPVTAVAAVPAGGLVASGPDGLARSLDDGRRWSLAVPGESGWVRHLSVDADRVCWAVSHDGTRILRCGVDGEEWSEFQAPWVGVDVLALLASPEAVLAATRDPHRRLVALWRSTDGAKSWRRAAEVPAARRVAACTEPPTVVAGGACFVRDRSDGWSRGADLDGSARQVAGRGDALVAVTDRALLLSTDRGGQWRRLDGLPAAEVLDVALTADGINALTPEGRVWSHRVGST